MQFGSKSIGELCTEFGTAARTLGHAASRRSRQRLDDLRAARALEVMRALPGRCHGLKGDRAGQLSLGPERLRRLIFAPANDSVPASLMVALTGGGVTAVRMPQVEDTHG
jgi:proteic killer suppression protein